MYEHLTRVIDASGIWNGSQRHTHAFLLSPAVYQLSHEQAEELQALGPAFQACLRGLAHIASIAYDRQFNYKGPWLLARRVFSSGVPKAYHPLQAIRPRDVPRLLKVDLMLDTQGRFRIAEIDGHNKHGLGYSTLGRRFRQAIMPEAAAFPGTVKLLADEVRRLGYEELHVLAADQERFYLPEFRIAQAELGQHGIACHLWAEQDILPDRLNAGLYLDLPFFFQRPDLYRVAAAAYQEGRTQYIIPPKPFLGAKAVLALLRNDSADGDLENLLRVFIGSAALERVRNYLPETYLVGRQAPESALVTHRLQEAGARYVLKESISSGMKGTVFSDDGEFARFLRQAQGTNLNWILQAEVQNGPQTFPYYAADGQAPPLETASDWFMRITVQYINRKLGDVMVTARRHKAVHGAKDCLQLGSAIV